MEFFLLDTFWVEVAHWGDHRSNSEMKIQVRLENSASLNFSWIFLGRVILWKHRRLLITNLCSLAPPGRAVQSFSNCLAARHGRIKCLLMSKTIIRPNWAGSRALPVGYAAPACDGTKLIGRLTLTLWGPHVLTAEMLAAAETADRRECSLHGITQPN